MKWFILIISLSLIGCETESEKAQYKKIIYARELYSRITAQVYKDGMSESWKAIEDNILDNKKILYIVASEEFSILVVRNSFNGMVDTSIAPVTDTSSITTSPEVDKISDAIKNLETLAKKMGGK